MHHRTFDTTSRRGFTLVELLVTMTIILILVGLLIPAVMMVRARTDQTRNAFEIAQLDNALAEYKKKYDQFPPSQIILYDECMGGVSRYGGTDDTRLAKDSLAAIQPIFLISMRNPYISGVIDWNQNGVTTDGPILTGDQCLLFFLGGPKGRGYTTTTTGSFNKIAVANESRISMFYEFDPDRLTDYRGNGIYSYLDVYGTMPYAYYSNYNTTNGYSRYCIDTSELSDCGTMGGVRVWPYASSFHTPLASPPVLPEPVFSNSATWPRLPQPIFLNPDRFQIISAGRDKIFGRGSPYGHTNNLNYTNSGGGYVDPYASPTPNPLPKEYYWPLSKPGSATVWPMDPGGRDDQSNFSQRLLGD